MCRLRVLPCLRSHCSLTADAECVALLLVPQLRELVVDAVPAMCHDTDELTLEYKSDQHSKWVRVKTRTPVAAVKAARIARITVAPGNRRAPRR